MARFNGGSNAGHTVVLGDSRHTFHLIPSGALKGKQLLIGAGVAVDPAVLSEELSMLPGEARSRVTVDARCSLVTPLDKELDARLEEERGASAIGTTRRGIGPSYGLRALRLSPRVSDVIGGFDYGPLSGFYRKFSLDPAGLQAWGAEAKALLEGIAGDAGERVREISDRGGNVLFETAQGTLLDLLHGTYPFVTATHTTASYIPAGLGISPSLAGESLGVMKCYTTRVGSGPFPSEAEGPLAEKIRRLGNEYGATTGRPRRVGWLDLVSLRYALDLNGAKQVAVSKLDVLSKVDEFRVCTAYKLDGSEVTRFEAAADRLADVEPVFESPLSLHGAVFDGSLPSEGKALIRYLEESLRVKVKVVSYGEERTKTIEL